MSDHTPVPARDPEKPSLAIELKARKVTLELTCADHYAAIELYDQLIADARRAGIVTLTVGGLRARREE